MLKKVLVANRGEIAARIVRTCAELGIASVAVYSDPDERALHVRLADEAVRLPGSSAADTYLDADALVAAAVRTGADAIHPGYGFLSESASFAEQVERTGLTFVGPPPRAIAELGDKVSARALAVAAGVPVVPGSEDPDVDAIVAYGTAHGWPVVVKASRGGGGRGMRVARSADEAAGALASAKAEAMAAFGDDTVYVERYLERPRHVEVQVLADTHGAVVALGDRDCSVQRRHQKLVEEAPAPDLDDGIRRAMGEAATALVRQSRYSGAGTVEFLVEGEAFFFLECNTRLQVEHPVTEAVLGLDLVREQLRIAAGEHLDDAPVSVRGHAFEVRVNAEDPARDFLPTPGPVLALSVPWRPGVRVDTGYEPGDEIPEYYDSLVAKLVVWGPTRDVALHRLRSTLDATVIDGITTTVGALAAVVGHPEFAAGAVDTHWFERTVARQLVPSPDTEAPAGPGEPGVRIAGRRYRIPTSTSRDGSVRQVRARLATATAGRTGPAAGFVGDVTSPMRGTVAAVAVTQGATVARGDLIATVEAMKMEHRIAAGADAVVEAVCVQPGDTVGPGDVVATLVAIPSEVVR